MSILSRYQFIEKAFAKLFQTNGRVMFEINEIAEMLKIQPNPAQIVEKILDNQKQFKSVQIFKWQILLNKLIMDFIIEPSEIVKIIEKIECKQENDFDQLLNKKLIKPYKLYLMKRCQFLPKKSEKIDRMYQLMNLIQTATSFSEFIYTLGRYYSKIYPYAADFNIILGSDLNTVYNQMVKYTPKPATPQILQQFEKIHEKMYIIYYNCYYYKFLKPFVPRWVVTDLTSTQIKNNSKQYSKYSPNISSNKSMVETAASSSLKKLKTQKREILNSTSEFDLSKSTVFQIPNEKSKKLQESIMLLRSMERVFEELQDV